jgi:hypothetical protein
MPAGTVHYILCPGCEAAVHELTEPRCPHCRRCSLCGRKLESDDTGCSCGYIDDPERVEDLLRKFEISAEDVPRERRRLETRKELSNRKSIISTAILGLLSFAYTGVLALAGPRTKLEWFLFLFSYAMLMLLAIWCVERLIWRMATQRLEAEFPQGENPYQRRWN